MKIFEYKTIRISFYNQIEKELNDAGKEGWELVNAVRLSEYISEQTFFFKREIVKNES